MFGLIQCFMLGIVAADYAAYKLNFSVEEYDSVILNGMFAGDVSKCSKEFFEHFQYFWLLSEQDEPTEEGIYGAVHHMTRRLGEDGPYNNC